MKALAQNDIVRVESDDVNATSAMAKVLLKVFSKYQLENTPPGQSVLISTHTSLGQIDYYVHQKVLH